MTGVEVTLAAVETDRLGTFSGEVPREGSPLDTARRKAQWAIDHTGARIGLGSEGSFGPHPDTPFLVVGLELAVCLDARDDLEIVERIMSVDTNFRHLDLTALPIPPGYLDAVGFPAHALVVAPPTSGTRCSRASRISPPSRTPWFAVSRSAGPPDSRPTCGRT
jgi:hypothetical protein